MAVFTITTNLEGEQVPTSIGLRASLDQLIRRPALLGVILLLLATTLRLALMQAIGFGNDEAYTLTSARALHLSYFDHPPLHLWIAHLAVGVFGETSWARMPTVLIFTGTGWLMFTATRRLFGAPAALWALAALNLTPFFTVSAGSWVVPDGPLIFCLLAAVVALLPVLMPRVGEPCYPWRAWLTAGLFLGLAGLSKYSAVFMAIGLLGFLVTSARQRHWLRHPAPYLGAFVALLVLTPALVWNARNHWASMLFQGTRGLPRAGLHPTQLFSMLAGEFVLLSPWIAVPMVAAIAASLRRRSDDSHLFLLWLTLPAIVVFSVIPLWSARGLPHWSMPGWLFAFPLLGRWLAVGRRRWFRSCIWSICATLTFASVLAAGLRIASVGLPWSHSITTRSDDPTLESLAWTTLRHSEALQAMHADFVVTTRWMDAGKIALAVPSSMPVAVFSDDPRQFAFGPPLDRLLGRDAAIVVPARLLDETLKRLHSYFATFDPAEHLWLGRQGRPELDLALVHAHALQRLYPNPYASMKASGDSDAGR